MGIVPSVTVCVLYDNSNNTNIVRENIQLEVPLADIVKIYDGDLRS